MVNKFELKNNLNLNNTISIDMRYIKHPVFYINSLVGVVYILYVMVISRLYRAKLVFSFNNNIFYGFC